MPAVSYRLTFASRNPLLNFTPKSGLADPAKVPTVRFVPFSDAEGGYDVCLRYIKPRRHSPFVKLADTKAD